MLRPWCALEFGDVALLHRQAQGRASRNADLWLAFPADGEEREALYKLTKGEDSDGGGLLRRRSRTPSAACSRYGPAGLAGALLGLAEGRRRQTASLPDERQGATCAEDPAKVELQEKGGTFTRGRAAGLVGARAARRDLPAALPGGQARAGRAAGADPAAARAGDAARAGLRRLGPRDVRRLGEAARRRDRRQAGLRAAAGARRRGAASARRARTSAGSATWLLQIAFWWGVLIKRKELTGFLSVGQDDERRAASALVRAYQNARAAGALAAGARAAATALPGRAHTKATRARPRRSRPSGAPSRRPRRRSSTARHARPRARAGRGAPLVAMRRELERRRRALDRELGSFERSREVALAQGEQPRAPTDEEQALIAERGGARPRARLGADARRRASAARERARPGARGAAISRAELAAWREQRRRDIDAGLPAGPRPQPARRRHRPARLPRRRPRAAGRAARPGERGDRARPQAARRPAARGERPADAGRAARRGARDPARGAEPPARTGARPDRHERRERKGRQRLYRR